MEMCPRRPDGTLKPLEGRPVNAIILYVAGVVAALAYVATWVHALKGVSVLVAGPGILNGSPRNMICGSLTGNP
jgi:hypothetical protein